MFTECSFVLESIEWMTLIAGRKGGVMLQSEGRALGMVDGPSSGSDLEKDLIEVIKSLEQAALEIEKLAWDNDEDKQGACFEPDS